MPINEKEFELNKVAASDQRERICDSNMDKGAILYYQVIIHHSNGQTNDLLLIMQHQ